MFKIETIIARGLPYGNKFRNSEDGTFNIEGMIAQCAIETWPDRYHWFDDKFVDKKTNVVHDSLPKHLRPYWLTSEHQGFLWDKFVSCTSVTHDEYLAALDNTVKCRHKLRDRSGACCAVGVEYTLLEKKGCCYAKLVFRSEGTLPALPTKFYHLYGVLVHTSDTTEGWDAVKAIILRDKECYSKLL